MSEGFKPLGESLGSLLAGLEERVRTAMDLTQKVRTALPGDEKDHVISASYQDESLIVYMDSAAWCAQVRYASDAVLASLNANSETQFTKLKVRVAAR